MFITPSLIPLHVIFVPVAVALRAAGSMSCSAGFRMTTHPVCAASLICTLYVDGPRFVKLPEPCQFVPPFMLNS